MPCGRACPAAHRGAQAPFIDLRLQLFALGQQGPIQRCKIRDDGAKPLPEGVGRHTGAGKGLVLNEIVKCFSQPAGRRRICVLS